MLDALGLGPEQLPFREVHRQAGVSLRRYGSDGGAAGPPALIVPAPIKRAYIWDLAHDVSAVRRCLDAVSCVYLADWQAAPPQFGLAEYAGDLILACLDAARVERALLVGHSLGGLFAAIFAALHPQRVQGLVLLAAPLHFGADTAVLGRLAAGLDAGDLPESLPGSFLSAASANAAPLVFGAERAFDALLSASDPARLRTHLLVERWALDEFPLPRRLVADLVTQIMREDRFVRGTLEISGRRATPSGVQAPLLCVLDPRCRLVPPEAVLPFVEAAASHDKTVLHYEGDVGVGLQHLGPLVGRNAHAQLWPQIGAWMARTAS